MALGAHDVCYFGEIGNTIVWRATLDFIITKIDINIAPYWASTFADWIVEVYDASFYNLPTIVDANSGDIHTVTCIDHEFWFTVNSEA